MPSDARLVLPETVVLGRAAMGERLARISLTDRRRVIRDERPAMVEAIGLSGEDLTPPGHAGLDGAVAISTLSLFAFNAEDMLGPVRETLAQTPLPVRAAASDGRVTIRFMAREAYALRRPAALLPVLTRAPLPRAWQIRPDPDPCR